MNDVTTGPAPLRVSHDEWVALAGEEYRRLDALLASLEAGDWQRRTDCPDWDVRQLVAHLVGAAEAAASARETVRQQRLGRSLRRGRTGVDGMNEVQVRERQHLGPGELRAALADAGARGLAARRRMPALLRMLPVRFGPPLGTRPLGYLTDRIYTRDAWLHRVDICRATGRVPVLDASHDGRLVADVVQEWAAAHGRPVELHLTGPAGGSWSFGDGGDRLEVDAVQLCRILSGRDHGEGLLAHRVPF